VIVIDLRKQKKETMLPSMQEEENLHARFGTKDTIKDINAGCCNCHTFSVRLSHSVIVMAEALSSTPYIFQVRRTLRMRVF